MNIFRKLFRKKIPEGYYSIKEIKYTQNEGLQVIAEHPEFIHFINDVVELFFKSGADNFFTLNAYHPKLGEFEITVQKKWGKSPAEMLAELRKKIAELSRGRIGE